MTLPRAYALLDYWSEQPPTHDAVRIAWLKVEKRQPEAEGQQKDANEDVSALVGMDGVQQWSNFKPFTPADVERLAAEAKAKERGNADER